MTYWYPHELAKLSGISVRALHHYDRIGLLKPSLRESNNYRAYSEADLFKLQQIIALKFFGFSLSQVKTLIAEKADVLSDFEVQSHLLQKKAEAFMHASKSLKALVAEYNPNKSVSWETIIQTIEVYRMTEKIENTWVTNVLNHEELKDYAEFERGLKDRFGAQAKKQFEEDWKQLTNDVKANLVVDPASAVGKALGKRCMNMVNNLYGKDFAHLRTSLWEKGFKEGHASQHGMTVEMVEWLDRAMDAYWRDRIYTMLNSADNVDSNALKISWESLLDEMYAKDESGKLDLMRVALADDNVNEHGKKWLRSSYKLTK